MSDSVSHLSAVPPATPQALPDCEHLLALSPRRPGELHEPLGVALQPGCALAEHAATAGVAVDLAAALMLEAQLLLEDLEAFGAAPPPAQPTSAARVTRRLSAAEADYLRALTLRRRLPKSGAPPKRLVLPVRLLPHADPRRLARAAEGDLGRTLDWEVAALLAGMTLREWGLRYARGPVGPNP